MHQRTTTAQRIKQTGHGIQIIGDTKTALQRPDLADLSCRDAVLDLADQRQKPGPHRLHAKHPGHLCRLRDAPGGGGIHGKRLLDQHRLACRDGQQRMGLVFKRRCGDIDGIDITGGSSGIIRGGLRQAKAAGKGLGIGRLARGHTDHHRGVAQRTQAQNEFPGDRTRPENRPANRSAGGNAG